MYLYHNLIHKIKRHHMLVDPCFLTNWCVSRGLNVTVVLFSNSITNTFKISHKKGSFSCDLFSEIDRYTYTQIGTLK